MPATDTEHTPGPPAPPRPASGTDPVLLLTLGLVIALILGATFYLCVAHPRLAGPVSAVGGVAGGLTAAIGIAIGIRRR
ncbi:hypothetical protein ACFXEL_38115 [Streptomyces sp. NPDC059382]|uniref:hypothetical protein n=1 Tax=Streptomyces sp. NPDC059382 TaxID=3346816 RepID=UPI00367C6FB5